MENYVKNVNNDFLSQSYSQSIERITGTKDHIFNFQIPKKLLKIREKAWVNLFGKYSEEMSDDIELNVDTLEPDEDEIEKEICKEEYSCEHLVRIPMRKPATMVQYWINTGNQPYKALIDENESSEIGASLSEKEITLSLYSSVSNIINQDIELCSMSKEYVASKTREQPTTNIVTTSGNTMQLNMHSQSCEHIDKMNVPSTSRKGLDIQSRDNTVRQFDETSKRLTEDGDNNGASNQDKMLEKDLDTSNEEGGSENITQEIITRDTSLTAFYRKKLYTGRNSPVDLTQTERHSISRLSGAKQNLHPALDSDCTIKKETLLVHKGKSKNSSSFEKTNLGLKKMKRKKRRKRYSISDKNITDTSDELPNTNKIQNYIIDSSIKISSDQNFSNSDKQDDILLSEHNNANIFVRKERCKEDLVSFNINPVVLLERIAPSFKQHEFKSSKNNLTRESNVHNRHLYKSSKLYTCEVENVELETIDSDNSTILVCQCKINAQHSGSFSKESDCSLNLRLNIEDDFSASNTEEKDNRLSNLINTDVSQNKEPYTTTLGELSPSLSPVNENCKNVRSREVKIIVERLPSSAMESQMLNKNDTVRKKNILSKKSKTLSSNSYRANKIGNVTSREIKVILERLPASVNKNSTNRIMKTELSNKSDVAVDSQQQEILSKFKTHSFNTCGINKTDNVKLREIKIALERLPSHICFNNTNIFADKNIISENTNLLNNKRKRRFEKMSKISTCENAEACIGTVDKVDNNYSFRTRTKSKKNNDPNIIDISDIVAEHQMFDKIESEFPVQYKNDNKVSQDNCTKYSVLTFTSSDEDDFVRMIQHPKKRSKLDETNITEKNLCNETKFVATNKEKYYYNRNLKTVIFSSKEPKTKRETFESIKEKKGSSGMEIKSFDNKTTSLKMRENEKLLFSPNENDNDSVAKSRNLDKRKKRASFLNYNRSINNNNERCSNAIVKRNGLDRKDVMHGIVFQTKTFYSDSSDSEENNSYIAPIRKAYKNSFIHHKLQYHNHANLEEFFNDSITNKCNSKHSNSLNSSFEKHDVANRMHNIKIGVGSTSKEAKINKSLLDNEEFRNDINSRLNNTRKNTSSSISLGKNNFSSLSKNKQISKSDKSKNLTAIQQGDVNSTKLLMFQTKTYYDSDSNESL
ncbi:uncharacterized protein [Anoplolepis gracilipes]|uniref:uncharacterized protein isoform X2 n=1 Tax=Anoplolepis gracilipes TaxID=354296 RepID=UPI003BA1BBA5